MNPLLPRLLTWLMLVPATSSGAEVFYCFVAGQGAAWCKTPALCWATMDDEWGTPWATLVSSALAGLPQFTGSTTTRSSQAPATSRSCSASDKILAMTTYEWASHSSSGWTTNRELVGTVGEPYKIAFYVAAPHLRPDKSLGHAFFQLLPNVGPDAGRKDLVYGLHPASNIGGLLSYFSDLFTAADTAFSDDSLHPWDWRITYPIDRTAYNVVVNSLRREQSASVGYNILRRNCVDWSIRFAGIAGVTLPPFQSPGRFGVRNDPAQFASTLSAIGNGGRVGNGVVIANTMNVLPTDAPDPPFIVPDQCSASTVEQAALEDAAGLAQTLQLRYRSEAVAVHQVTVNAPFTVRLQNVEPGKALTVFDFADRTVGGGALAASHAYQSLGMRQARVIVIDSGAISEFKLPIEVVAKPAATDILVSVRAPLAATGFPAVWQAARLPEFQGSPPTTRYVAPAGVDGSTCEIEAAPCRTIHYALSIGTDGDIIRLSSGTYSENLRIPACANCAKASLTIEGVDAGTTIVDAQAGGPGLETDEDVQVELRGVTFANGRRNGGGGGMLIRAGSRVTLTNSVLRNNAALWGGGIAAVGATLVLDGSAVYGNEGGGLDVESWTNAPASTIVRNSAIRANQGTGIHNASGSQLLVENSLVSEHSGPGLYNDVGAGAAFVNSRLIGNRNGVQSAGGGVFNQGGRVALTSTDVSNNEAATGAGIHNQVGVDSSGAFVAGQVTLTHSSVNSNRSSGAFGAAGIFNVSSDLVVDNSQIVGNSAAQGRGAGLYSIGSATVGGQVLPARVRLNDSAVRGNLVQGIPNGTYNGAWSTFTPTRSVVDGGFEQVGGSARLLLEVSSTTSYDRLDVSGPASLSGIVQIDLSSSAALTVGSAIDIIKATQIKGYRRNLFQLSALPAGRVPCTALVNRGALVQFRVLANSPPLGDMNCDDVVDIKDVSLITEALGPASGNGDPRDVDEDGFITVLDARKLVLQCTRANCR